MANKHKLHTIWLQKYYDERIEEGNFCSIYEQEQWDGFSNNLALLNFMSSKGWVFVHSCKDVKSQGFFFKTCLAKRTSIELVFKRKSKL